MNPLRYFLRAIAFSVLRGWPIRTQYVGVLAGRAIGGWIARRCSGAGLARPLRVIDRWEPF